MSSCIRFGAWLSFRTALRIENDGLLPKAERCCAVLRTRFARCEFQPLTVPDIEVRRAKVACMVPLSIRLILETNKEQNALKVLARLKNLFDFELRALAPYIKGGFEANIVAHLDDGPWPSVVLRTIQVAQSFGDRRSGSGGNWPQRKRRIRRPGHPICLDHRKTKWPLMTQGCRLARCTKVVSYLRYYRRAGRTAAIAVVDPLRSLTLAESGPSMAAVSDAALLHSLDGVVGLVPL
jgi:hypothetical protein